MSVHWGLWNFEKAVNREHDAAELARRQVQWGPDGQGAWSNGAGLTFGLRSFHVTHEDFRQIQPYTSPESGNVYALDGRIDNRAELMDELGLRYSQQRRVMKGSWNPAAISSPPFPVLVPLPTQDKNALVQQAQWVIPPTEEPTDLELVAAAFDRWGSGCFQMLKGDWVLVVWSTEDQSLWLVKDIFGPRHLHYIDHKGFFCWATRFECLAGLIRDGYLAPAQLTQDLRYKAANALALPSADAAPYREIRSVPPAHSLCVSRDGRIRVQRFSNTPARSAPIPIPFQHAATGFRTILERSLLNRMRSAFPVTFELSGGCDSSTLVCLAHRLRRERLLIQDIYTLTCYQPSQAQSHDRHFARIVEDHIGQRGYHVPVHEVTEDEERIQPSPEELAAYDAESNAPLEHSSSVAMQELWFHRARYTDIMSERGSRVLLCGIGGDELTGGIQSAADSLCEEWHSRSLRGFFQSLQAWARYKNQTVWHLLWEIGLETLPLILSSRLAGTSRRQADAAQPHLPGLTKTSLRMMRLAYSGAVRPWRSNRRQDEFIWPMSPVLSHRQRLCHIGCWHRSFPFVNNGWVRLAAQLPPEFIQTAFQRRRLIRAAVSDAVPHSVLWRRTKDYGTWVARTANGDGKRQLKDLEENAELLQIIRAASSGPARPTKLTAATEVMSVNNALHQKCDAETDRRRYAPAAHVRFVADGRGATLLDTAKGKRIVLNSVGATIWRQLVGGENVAAIAFGLAATYNISPHVALEDTEDFIQEFVKNGVVESRSNDVERDLNVQLG